MANALVLMTIALSYALLFIWAFRTLPSERWQFLASIPTQRVRTGTWNGLNLTFYGLFTSSAVTLAVTMAIVLLGSLGVPLSKVGLFVMSLLIVTVPAARVMAWLIEGKANGFTIGGAAFIGLVTAPGIVWAINILSGENNPPLPLVGSLAVLTVAYAFGEGTGRVACISFGCCYGQPVFSGPSWRRYLFRTRHFIFSGATKKASYESGFENVPLIPIQAVTAVVLVSSALLGLALFLPGSVSATFVVTLFLTQAWRVFSEIFRADHRGGQRFTAYQMMALAGIFYGLLVTTFASPDVAVLPDIVTGLTVLWRPMVIISLQALWLTIFLYTGRSTVTTAQISFSVLKDRI